MRIVVFILSILGTIGSGFIGFVWLTESNKIKQNPKAIVKDVEKFDNLVKASYALGGVALLGVVGGVLALAQKKLLAALFLLLPTTAPSFFALSIDGALTRVLVGCSPLLLGGLLTFTIRGKPKAAPPKRDAKRRTEAEEDELEEQEATFLAGEEHAGVPAAEPFRDEGEIPPAVFDEVEERPRPIAKFVCPSCDTFLKASAPLPLGKPFKCPKCREAVTVTPRL